MASFIYMLSAVHGIINLARHAMIMAALGMI
jgi:hypothetical protein